MIISKIVNKERTISRKLIMEKKSNSEMANNKMK